MHMVIFIRIVEKDNVCYWERHHTDKAVKKENFFFQWQKHHQDVTVKTSATKHQTDKDSKRAVGRVDSDYEGPCCVHEP